MRQIAEILRDLAGDRYQEMIDQLGEVVRAAMETGKGGALTVALKIKPNAANAVQVECEIKAKIPTKPPAPTIFFVANGGSLVRNDPSQMRLPLRDVALPPEQVVAPLKAAVDDVQIEAVKVAQALGMSALVGRVEGDGRF